MISSSEICLLLTNRFVVNISANIVMDRSLYTGSLSFDISDFQVCKEWCSINLWKRTACHLNPLPDII